MQDFVHLSTVKTKKLKGDVEGVSSTTCSLGAFSATRDYCKCCVGECQLILVDWSVLTRRLLYFCIPGSRGVGLFSCAITSKPN